MASFSALIRPDLQHFSAYSSARLEASQGQVWLNANELPWDQQGLNRYPEQQPLFFMQQLADYYQLPVNQVLATRGSDEGIDLLMRLFCQAGQDAILICPPTFGMYAVSAALQGAGVLEVPLRAKDFSLDVTEIVSQYHSAIKLVFLCSPNNPTGNFISLDSILSLAKELLGRALVVVDEAYIEFSGQPSVAQSISQYDNIVVLRTFSKAFGLAAARVGAVLAHAEVITALQKILPPYPLPQCSIQAVQQVLYTSREKMAKQVSLLVKERDYLAKAINSLPCVAKVWPSSANFILVKFTVPVMQHCYQQGVVLRDMQSKTGIAHAVRVTVGTPEQNRQLIEVLKQC